MATDSTKRPPANQFSVTGTTVFLTGPEPKGDPLQVKLRINVEGGSGDLPQETLELVARTIKWHLNNELHKELGTSAFRQAILGDVEEDESD